MQVIGSPIGAYLLLHLDAAHLQLSIAGVLTLVFLSMVITPAQCKEWSQSIRNKLSKQKQAKHAQRQGYSELASTPRLGPMQDKPKSTATESTHPKPVEQLDKPSSLAPETQILKPSMLPATTMHSAHAIANSSSLGSLAPHAPPPINISAPTATPFAQAALGSARSTWSMHNSLPSTTRRGSLTAASFNPEFLQHYLDADSNPILARSASRLPPPVVRVTHNSMDLVKQDVQSFHSSSPAMSWMRRLQPDCSTVVINYPVEYDQDRLQEDLEAGRSPDFTPSSIPTPSPTRPPFPLPEATSGTHPLVHTHNVDPTHVCCGWFEVNRPVFCIFGC